ncbi:O-acetyltransferase WecH [Dyella sp. AD56]|uniref:acyltransferase family protein n=2 Tax=unclassified Dyella TaxID=2634549 RepID=UPI000CBF967A|nr:acyltransferase [Dyella sp. AD56]PMQ06020.1 O-acetyltransferase WecH [Dyella sp. AD56]
MEQSKVDKIEFIQALRGIASLLVVFWHGSRFFAPYGEGWSGVLLRPAAPFGVDLFFLISGFIMLVTTRRSDGSKGYVATFFIKRFARIWPVYVIATAILLLLISYRREPFLSWHGFRHLVEYLFFLPLHGPNGGDPGVVIPALSVGWTLNYEMYFYAVLAASLLFGRARWLAFFLWMALTLLVIPGVFSATPLSVDPSVNYQFHGYLRLATNPIILLFAAGVIIGIIYDTRLTIANPFYGRLSIFAVVCMVIFQYCSGFRADHGLFNWGLTLVPLMLVLALALKTIDWEVSRPLLYLGDISFSLYLFHPIAQEWFDRYNVRLSGTGPLAGFAAFFITSAIAIVLACLSHRYLELGVSNRMRDVLLRPMRKNRLRRNESLTVAPSIKEVA